MRLHKLILIVLSTLFIMTFIGCGSEDKPYWPSEIHSDISATIKLIGEDTVSYKTVFGTHFSSSDTYYLINGESSYASASGNTPLQTYILSGANLTVYYSGHSSSYRRLPNVGIRTGEEPMMNLITDAMLYFGRKNFNGAKSSSGTKDDGFKKIRIAAHNGGGIWKTYPDSYPVTNFNVGQSAKNIKDFIRFDNHLAVVEFTPQTLKNLIEYSLGGMKYRNGDATTTTAGGVSDGNFIHWSGLSFTYDRGASSAANNAFYYNSSAATVDNQGARVRDLYLFNVPEYDAINDQYDTALRDALNNPQDSIAVVLNGSVVPAQANTKIYGVIVDFLALTELAAQAAMDISGLGDEKLLYIDAINRPNEAIDAVVSNSNYTLYHRLQGRIRAVE